MITYTTPSRNFQHVVLQYLLDDFKTIPGYTRYDKIFLNHFNCPQEEVDKALNALLAEDLIYTSFKDPFDPRIILQPKAFVYFQKLEEDRLKEIAEEKARKKMFRHEWLLALFSAVTGAAFGAAASVIMEFLKSQ